MRSQRVWKMSAARSRGLAAAVAAMLLAGAVAAQGDARTLRELEAIEVRLLAAEERRYDEANREESRALEALGQALRAFHSRLASERTPLEVLRREQERAEAARQTAAGRLREAAALRAALIERRERLEVIRQRLREAEAGRLVPASGIDGRWRVELSPLGLAGVLELRSDGSLLTGTYRLDGSAGSVRGTLEGARLRLERIDLLRGLDAVLEAEIDPGYGELRGTWTAVDVSGGAPSGGTWSGRREGAPRP